MKDTTFILQEFFSIMVTSQVHTVKGLGTAMMDSQGRKVTSMKLVPQKKGCRYLTQVEDRTPVTDEQKQGKPKALRG